MPKRELKLQSRTTIKQQLIPLPLQGGTHSAVLLKYIAYMTLANEDILQKIFVRVFVQRLQNTKPAYDFFACCFTVIKEVAARIIVHGITLCVLWSIAKVHMYCNIMQCCSSTLHRREFPSALFLSVDKRDSSSVSFSVMV